MDVKTNRNVIMKTYQSKGRKTKENNQMHNQMHVRPKRVRNLVSK